MSSVLNDELKEAIQKNLPQMVGAELQSILNDHDELKVDFKRLEDQYESVTSALNKIKEKNRDYEANETKAKELEKKEFDLLLREKVLEVNEKHTSERIGEMKGIVQTVFQSNRFGYNVSLSKTENEYVPPTQANNFQGSNIVKSQSTHGVITEQS